MFRINYTRRGLTLAELLIATAIMTIIALSLAAMATTSRTAGDYVYAQTQTSQHARVVIRQIESAIASASGNEQFPGCLAVSTTVGSATFPDALVVWIPSTDIDADTVPRMSEFQVFVSDADDPRILLRLQDTTDTRVAPSVNEPALWLTEIAALQSSQSAERVELTSLLRTAATSNGVSRAALRFHTRLLPSQTEWDSYQAGSTSWSDLAWVQGIYGSDTGLRQTWCHFEIQLIFDSSMDNASSTGNDYAPFFGSAALYYTLQQ